MYLKYIYKYKIYMVQVKSDLGYLEEAGSLIRETWNAASRNTLRLVSTVIFPEFRWRKIHQLKRMFRIGAISTTDYWWIYRLKAK